MIRFRELVLVRTKVRKTRYGAPSSAPFNENLVRSFRSIGRLVLIIEVLKSPIIPSIPSSVTSAILEDRIGLKWCRYRAFDFDLIFSGSFTFPTEKAIYDHEFIDPGMDIPLIVALDCGY